MGKILIVVDMQNDFISGSLGTKEAQAIVKNVVKRINTYVEEEEQVIYTRDTHYENYLQTNEGKNLPVEHCIKDTWGWQLHEEIEKTRTRTMQVYDKNTFGSVALAEDIAKQYKDDPALQVELVGLCTDICVVSNALLLKAYCPEMQILVTSTCCAGVTATSHESALETMKMCQIIIN